MTISKVSALAFLNPIASPNKIKCPVLHLWGSNSHVGRNFKPVEAWAPWCEDVRGWSIPTGHYPSEHRPDLIYPTFWEFFTGREPMPYAGD